MKKLIKRYSPLLFIFSMIIFSFMFAGKEIEISESIRKVPVIMYHSVREGKNGKYTVSKEELEGDLKYLVQKGYKTLTCKELFELLRDDGHIPPKTCILTFDDGFYNNLVYALPLLEKYDMKAVISVVGEFTEEYDKTDDRSPAYAYLGSEDIKKLISSGRIEIGNHSFSMHRQGARKGSMKIKGESSEHYKEAFTEDTEKCWDHIYKNCNYKMTTYTFPYGQISEEAKEYLKDMGYTVFLTCYEKTNTVEGLKMPLVLGRFNRDGRLKTSEFMGKAGIF